MLQPNHRQGWGVPDRQRAPVVVQCSVGRLLLGVSFKLGRSVRSELASLWRVDPVGRAHAAALLTHTHSQRQHAPGLPRPIKNRPVGRLFVLRF